MLFICLFFKRSLNGQLFDLLEVNDWNRRVKSVSHIKGQTNRWGVAINRSHVGWSNEGADEENMEQKSAADKTDSQGKDATLRIEDYAVKELDLEVIKTVPKL